MSSFTSYIPDYQPAMDRLNASQKRAELGSHPNEREATRRRQENPMFFTNDDDNDSIFGGDEPLIIDDLNTTLRFHNPRLTSSQGLHTSRARADNFTTTNGGRSGAERTLRPTGGRFQKANALTSKPPNANAADTEAIEIKEEAEADSTADTDFLQSVPASERVRIFVGRRNRAVYVRRSDLSKSPMLLSYIIDDPVQGAFIMRPQLMSTHVDDFEALSQFLRSGEYAPVLLENPADPNGPRLLDGFKNDEQYAKELVRCGKLSVLARHFAVEGMPELVYRKVSEVDAGKFNIFSLVRVAEIVFKNRKNASEAAGGGTTDKGENTHGIDGVGGVGQDAVAQTDPLEEWIIGKLAHNFQEIMRTRSDKFWEVAKSTNKKMLFARVLEEVAERYRATGGKLPEPVIELD